MAIGTTAALLIGGGLAAGAIAPALIARGAKPSTPEAPPVPPTPEVDKDAVSRFLKKRKGRAKTIVAGDLTPTTLGKKTLLGD